MPGADPGQWYGTAPLSDDRPLQPEGVPVTVSPSAIEKFEGCALRWLLETSGGRDGSAGTAAGIGSLLHDLAHELAPRAAELDGVALQAELERELERRWPSLGLEGWVGRKEQARARAMVRLLTGYLQQGAPGLVGTELDVRVEIGRAVLTGRVDRLEVDSSGRPVVVDLKTTKYPPTNDTVAQNAQLGAYQLAVEHGAFERLDAVRENEPGGAALVHLGHGAASPRVQPQPPLAQAADPGWAAAMVARAADGMAAAAFPARVSADCDRCPVRLVVPGPARGRPARAAGSDAGRRVVSALTAVEVAQLLGLPAPTQEQAQVVEAPLGPQLVVAGAGSGKTETMASRVVWLVANDLVAPDAVLGLTFTRKAAGELAERVTRRLRTLRRVRPARGADGPAALEAFPRVGTYNAYAASLVADHGLRLGIEPGARLLGEAATWQVAHDVVEAWDATALESLDYALDTLVGAVLALAGQCAEHLLDPDDVVGLVDAVEGRLTGLPKDASGGAAVGPTASSDVGKALRSLRTRRALVPLLHAYAARKRDLGVLDFGDQVAIAARLAALPEVAAAERAQYGVVLLDEYQDTSHAQLELLSRLFGDGHAVTAVGDPHQSIYGWRGASAGNLDAFRDTFRDPAGATARVDGLSTSWRNPRVVLDLANTLAQPLVERGGVPVRSLRPRDDAPDGTVRVAWHATVDDEVADLADEIARLRSGEGHPTVAVLCRQRAQFPAVEKALRERGVPVEVVGLGGLLHRPEVADVVATLRVLHDPPARRRAGAAAHRSALAPRPPRPGRARGVGAAPGPATGRRDRRTRRRGRRRARPRRRRRGLGRRRARRPAAPRVDQLGRPRAVRGRRGTGSSGSPASWLGSAPPPTCRCPSSCWRSSARCCSTSSSRPGRRAGRHRRRAGARPARRLHRRRRAVPRHLRPPDPGRLPVLAEGGRDPRARPGAGRRRHRPRRRRRGRPRRGAGQPARRAGAHRARGQGPGVGRRGGARAARGAVPLGPHQGRPGHRVGLAHADRVAAVRAARRRRLAAVLALALGRARQGRRRVGGGAQAGLRRPRGRRGAASRLRRGDPRAAPAAAQRRVVEHPQEADEAVPVPRPRGRAAGRRPARGAGRDGAARPGAGRREPAPGRAAGAPVAGAGHGTRRAAGGGRRRGPRRGGADGQLALVPASPVVAALEDEVDRLLAEREALRRTASEVVLPSHLSASRTVRLARDPAELALALRRPVPTEPRAQTRLGTTFHEWVEHHLRSQALLDLDDVAGAGDADEPPAPGLEPLQDAFLASEWSRREVVDVEVDLETSVGGTVLRGRIDAVVRDDDGPDGRAATWSWTGRPARCRPATTPWRRQVQLAVYRLAWSRLHGVPPQDVRAAFFHVASGRTVWLDDAETDQERLEQVLGSLPTA